MNLEQAITQIKNKEEKGLSFLFDNYSGALKGIIVRIVNSEQVGEEILQQTFLKIWTKIDTFDASKSSIFTWMARIARNTAIDQKRLKRFENLNKTDTLDSNLHAGIVIENYHKMDVEKLISKLDDKYKVVLDCIYLQGFSCSEAADFLEVPIGTIKTRLRKSLLILREVLKDEKVLFTGGIFVVVLLMMLAFN